MRRRPADEKCVFLDEPEAWARRAASARRRRGCTRRTWRRFPRARHLALPPGGASGGDQPTRGGSHAAGSGERVQGDALALQKAVRGAAHARQRHGEGAPDGGACARRRAGRWVTRAVAGGRARSAVAAHLRPPATPRYSPGDRTRLRRRQLSGRESAHALPLTVHKRSTCDDTLALAQHGGLRLGICALQTPRQPRSTADSRLPSCLRRPCPRHPASAHPPGSRDPRACRSSARAPRPATPPPPWIC